MKPLKISIDQGVNLKKLKALQKKGKVVLVQAHDIEQIFKDVQPQGRAFTLDHSRLDGPDMLAGDNVKEIQSIVGLSNRADFQHIYAAYLNKTDYFITENPRDFIINGKRELLEEMLGIKIRRTEEFLSEVQQRIS